MLSDIACESIVNACQEYEELGGLATAKQGRKAERLDLAHPPMSETRANSLAIHTAHLLKSRASRQEKASGCNTNGAPANEHFDHLIAFELCRDVETAGAEHFDSLFDDDVLAAGNLSVAYKVG